MRKTFLTFFGGTLVALFAAMALEACAVAQAAEPLLALSAANITDVMGDMRGGLKRGVRILDRADLTATYSGDDHGTPGWSAFLDLQATDATDFSSAVVGDAQSVSNLDGPAGGRLLDAWVAKDFGGQGGLKAGVVDLNSEFDVQPTAALFLNAAFGIGPDFSQSGENGPSIFPSTGLGLVGWWLPGGHWQLKAGLFEGIPGDPAHSGRTSFSITRDEGALLVFEARNHLTPDFVIGAGTWRYTASFNAIDPARGRLSGNSGVYAIADGLLYADPEGENKGLSGWARIGFADDRINVMGTAIGAGLVYSGPFGRKTDQAGISVARALFGMPARRMAGGALLGPAETTFEATYGFAVSPHLTIQPDFQYVITPGGNPLVNDALVVGCRFTLTG